MKHWIKNKKKIRLLIDIAVRIIVFLIINSCFIYYGLVDTIQWRQTRYFQITDMFI